ncbi:MAG: sensor histidine kinase, partial [Chitinophagaceae bacterium]
SQLINVYYQLKQPQLMWKELTILDTNLTKILDKSLFIEFEKQLFQYYQLSNNTSKALFYLNKYVQKRDSAEASKLQFIQTDLQKEFKTKEQAKKISTLEEYNQLNNIFLKVVALAAILAVFIILLLYKNYRKTKEINQSLRQLNVQINQQREALQVANNEKDTILHIVAHDLRNPLGSIVGFINLLESRKQYDEKEKKIFDAIRKSTNQSIELITELLAKKMENEKSIALKKTNASINNLLQTAIEQITFKLTQKQQQIILNNSLPNNFQLAIDTDKIIRVLTNIFDNAVKFSNQNDIIVVNASAQNNQLIIEIIDNGIGLPTVKNNEESTINFEKRVGTNGEKSVGIGLSICKEIVEAHGGNLKLSNNETKGTTATIILPIA